MRALVLLLALLATSQSFAKVDHYASCAAVFPQAFAPSLGQLEQLAQRSLRDQISFQSLVKLIGHLERNEFEITRGLADVIDGSEDGMPGFGDSLLHSLNALEESDALLDLGGGTARVALEYAIGREIWFSQRGEFAYAEVEPHAPHALVRNWGRASVFAVSLKKPRATFEFEREYAYLLKRARYQYLEHPAEHLTRLQLPRIKLAIDRFGALSYSLDVARTMNEVMRALAIGGELFVGMERTSGIVYASEADASTNYGGIELLDFIASHLKGARVDVLHRTELHKVVRITKLQDEISYLDDLWLVGIKGQKPPQLMWSQSPPTSPFAVLLGARCRDSARVHYDKELQKL